MFGHLPCISTLNRPLFLVAGEQSVLDDVNVCNVAWKTFLNKPQNVLDMFEYVL